MEAATSPARKTEIVAFPATLPTDCPLPIEDGWAWLVENTGFYCFNVTTGTVSTNTCDLRLVTFDTLGDNYIVEWTYDPEFHDSLTEATLPAGSRKPEVIG